MSFALRVPRQLAHARLQSHNGNVDVSHLEGALQMGTENGGLDLRSLAGDVQASTTNGSIKVALAGSGWRGTGLRAQTTNGSISVKAPMDYSAQLMARTVNGSIAVGLPHTETGPVRNSLQTTVGRGGATLDFETTNGSIVLAHG